ncbi:MAG: bifunctional diaminohydroxyphosphoribosylaminopyrimidine deaminase/5-amino-6-(5-phosphoribosylamino)uracil reductase RibD [Flavobacteriales bacterium]
MSWTSSDLRWMQRALELAARGRLTTWPNPMVGCVVVQDDRMLGEGWHATFGQAHAEVNALKQVREGTDLSAATAYVTLEPCSHTGKTPPCADLLVTRGVGRVVVAMEDPNPKVSGRGVSRLTQAGVNVEVGCLEREARALIRPFVHAMTSPRPWITLKWAQSSDGFLDPEVCADVGRGGHPLTGASSGRHTHSLRAAHDGILVGLRTWLVDAPALTTRLVPGSNPKRFILTSGQTAWLEGAPQGESEFATLLCPLAEVSSNHMDAWREKGYAVVGLEGDVFSEAWWTQFKAKCDVAACMIEGGAQVARGVLDAGCWDELHVFHASAALQTGLKAPAIPSWPARDTQPMGRDVLEVWHNPEATC